MPLKIYFVQNDCSMSNMSLMPYIRVCPHTSVLFTLPDALETGVPFQYPLLFIPMNSIKFSNIASPLRSALNVDVDGSPTSSSSLISSPYRPGHFI